MCVSICLPVCLSLSVSVSLRLSLCRVIYLSHFYQTLRLFIFSQETESREKGEKLQTLQREVEEGKAKSEESIMYLQLQVGSQACRKGRNAMQSVSSFYWLERCRSIPKLVSFSFQA